MLNKCLIEVHKYATAYICAEREAEYMAVLLSAFLLYSFSMGGAAFMFFTDQYQSWRPGAVLMM